ncbi:MAG TPA: PP2C family protein-serine/threonine phosphatase [Dongiaceae bacterium]|nr:PP2C family protein-serine/threonine phosphatase [Dongiaceae bacterium]
MATTEIGYLQNELELRRERLIDATRQSATDATLRELLSNVDAALARLKTGTFGICEECHESIEADRLLCDPLVRFCLDHLSGEEQRALEKDLALAAGIQRALLPKSDWSVNGWQARYHYQPANLVSGDYCDLIESNGGFLFLLGDVAGKGVAASMLMSHLHATFRTLAQQHLPLQQMMNHANRLFCESTTAGQFATLIVGCASPEGKVEYVSAGHLPLFHLSSSGVRSREATGVPLGMFSNTEFHVCQLNLALGDKLLLYTDGLTEMFNSQGDEFGVCGVQALAKRHADATPDTVMAACLDQVRTFTGNSRQTDDLTLLVLHRAN